MTQLTSIKADHKDGKLNAQFNHELKTRTILLSGRQVDYKEYSVTLLFNMAIIQLENSLEAAGYHYTKTEYKNL